MVNHDPEWKEDLPEDIQNIEPEDDPFEDAFLSQSLKNMPELEVPSGFLPGVMFQVYEYHHREKIHLPTVFTIGVALLVACVGLFAWDIQDFAREQGHGSFSEAFSQRMDAIMASMDSLFSAMTGVMSASWQIVRGAMGVFISDTPFVLQALIFAGLAALIYLARKYLT